MENNEKITAVPVSMAAIDPYIQVNIISPTEKKVRGSNMVEWGDGHEYPQYLKGLYGTVTTLRTIIKGDIDFVAGDEVLLTPTKTAGVGDVTGTKMKSQAAGKMGYSTTEVGDLVCENL